METNHRIAATAREPQRILSRCISEQSPHDALAWQIAHWDRRTGAAVGGSRHEIEQRGASVAKVKQIADHRRLSLRVAKLAALTECAEVVLEIEIEVEVECSAGGRAAAEPTEGLDEQSGLGSLHEAMANARHRGNPGGLGAWIGLREDRGRPEIDRFVAIEGEGLAVRAGRGGDQTVALVGRKGSGRGHGHGYGPRRGVGAWHWDWDDHRDPAHRNGFDVRGWSQGHRWSDRDRVGSESRDGYRGCVGLIFSLIFSLILSLIFSLGWSLRDDQRERRHVEVGLFAEMEEAIVIETSEVIGDRDGSGDRSDGRSGRGGRALA